MSIRNQITLPENTTSKNSSDLMLAITFSKLGNNYDLSKLLLENYGNINKIDKDGKTLLINVLLLNNEYINNDIIKLIIDKGAYINKIPNPFLKMISELEDSVDAVIIEKFKKNTDIISSFTPLILATKKNNIEIVKYLLGKGANIDEQDDNGDTFLIAAVENTYFEIFKLAIESNANLDLLDKSGRSALYYAARSKNMEYAKILFNKGIKIDNESKSFKIAVANDINENRIVMSQLFFEKGATIKMLDSDGLENLRDAIKMENCDMCTLLINNGIDVNRAVSYSYNSVLMYTFNISKNDNLLKVIKLMILKGGIVNKEKALKKIDPSNKELIKMLNSKQSCDNELLLKAVNSKNINMIKLLLKKGTIDNDTFIEIIRLNDMDLLKFCCDTVKIELKYNDILNKLVNNDIKYDILNFIYENFN